MKKYYYCFITLITVMVLPLGTASLFLPVHVYSQPDTAWIARYNGPGNYWDAAWGIAVDGQGNVYVTGSSYGSGTENDYATIKYNSAGVQQWVARYNGPGNKEDQANAIAVDGQGNVYVTGYSASISTYPYNLDYATIKYNSAGVQQWVARYNGSGNEEDQASSIAVDGQGNVYVTGYSLGGINTAEDYATIKYNYAGVQQWVARYNGPGNYGDAASGIAVDEQSNVYVTGESGSDYATIKYNSAGVQQWVARYTTGSASAIGIDEQGNVYVTGESGSDYATIRYNSAGVQQWVARYNGSAWDLDDHVPSIAVDGQGNVYVTGTSAFAGTYYDYATIKYLQFTNDVGVDMITGLPRPMFVDSSYPVTVRIRNYGVGAQTVIPVYYDPGDGSPIVSETWTGTLEPNDTALYTFTQQYSTPTTPDTFTMKAYASLPTDERNANDMKRLATVVCPRYHTPPYYKDFNEDWSNSTNPPFCGWTIIDGGSESPNIVNGNDWHRRIQTPENSVAEVSYYPYEDHDDWLISPRFNCAIPEIRICSLRFWHRYDDMTPAKPDLGSVLISTDGGANWPIVVATFSNVDDEGYKSYDISSIISGQTNVKFAFHYADADGNEGVWLIDDFKVTAYNVLVQIKPLNYLFVENEIDTLKLSILVTNKSQRRITDIKIRGINDVSDLTFVLGPMDADQDGDIDYLEIDDICGPIHAKMWIPEIWEQKNITIQVYEIEGNQVDFRTTKRVSIYLTKGDTDNHAFRTSSDGYSFENSSFKLMDLRDWVCTIFTIENLFGSSSKAIYDVIAQFGGRCYGMAATSIVYFMDPSLKPVSVETYQMDSSNLSVRKEIIRYHLSQLFLPQFSGISSWGPVSPNQAESDIKNLLKSNKPFIICLRATKNYHAVTGYKLIHDHTGDICYMYLYDNNVKGSPQQIEWIPVSDRIIYDQRDEKYDVIGIKEQPKVMSYPEIIKKIGQVLKPVFKELLDKAKSLISHWCSVRMLLTDEYGRKVGFVDGTAFVNEIPTAEVTFIDNGDGDSSAYYEVPKDLNYTVKYFGTDTGNMDVEIIKPLSEDASITLGYYNIPLAQNTIITSSFDTIQNYNLYVDWDGDGTTDTVIPPSISNVAPSPFALKLPENNSEFSGITPTFVWEKSFDLNGDSVFYRVYIDTDSSFSSPDSSSILIDTTWVPTDSLTLNTTYYWKVKIWDSNGLVNWSIDPFWRFSTPSTVSIISINVYNRWNMISVPVIKEDRRRVIVFPTSTSNAFAYHGSYVIKDTLENGVGYWVKFSVEQSIDITGYPIEEDTIDVSEGWNMIGSITYPVEIGNIIENPNGIVISNYFEYNGTTYIIADSIHPGNPYWVKTNQAGQLILSPSVFVNQTKQKSRFIIDELPPPPPGDELSGMKEIPTHFALEQNYPNPFNPTTILKYQLTVESKVRLRIYNVFGQEIITIVDEIQDAGFKQVEWNIGQSRIASGVYFYRLEATSLTDPSRSFNKVRKMVVIK